MARFALLLPREEMVEPAGRIARELEMDVVLNQSVPTERILDLMEDCRRTGADILVARGRQASILKEHTDFPVVEIQLTGLEIARLLHRARSLVSHLERPKIGVVTIPNMVGNIQGFEEIFDIELHTYFISGLSEMERGAEQAREIMHRLACPSEVMRDACLLIRYHDRPMSAERSDLLRVMGLFAGSGLDTPRLMNELFDIKRADTLGKAPSCFYYVKDIERMREMVRELLANNEAYSVGTLAVSGADLIAAGVAPGPRIGALLRRALDVTVDGLVPNKRDDLLAYLDV